MSNADATMKKARAEVDNLVDELVQTIQNGVTHTDGSDGFKAKEAERLRAHLRVFAETIMDAAVGNTRADFDASVDKVVETIRNGVLPPGRGAPFGADEAAELRAALRTFAEAIVTAARTRTRAETDAPIDQVVKTIRSGLFHVYGRASFAAITADQLEAYLQTFVDAVLTVVETGGPAGGDPVAPPPPTAA